MAGLTDAWKRSAIGRLWKQSVHIELMHRSMGFAALGFVTLMPLLVVIAAATPWEHRPGFAQWVVDGMGLDTSGSLSVRSLFEIHGTAYMVMDFEDGTSLSKLLKDGRRFNERSLWNIIRPIAEGLDRLWELGRKTLWEGAQPIRFAAA